MIDSDQSPATGDDFEIDLGDLTVDTDNTEETESTESTETESHSEETVQKKSGYVEFTPEQQPRVDEITRKRYEAEREAKALRKELEQYRKPPEPPKEVPVPNADPITEPDLFARQQHERDNYIRARTRYDGETEAQTQAKQQAEVQKRSEMITGYLANMDRLKLDRQTLAKAAEVCARYGIDDNHPVTDDLLEDKDGPAIVKYLADHPDHLSEMADLRPTRALAYIEREIRPKLNTKTQSKAPPPPTKISGIRTAGNVEADGTLYE